jgi:hypothetical protein
MAEISALLRSPAGAERLRDWIIVVIVRVGAIPALALLIAALWLGIGAWAIPVVLAVGAVVVAVTYLRRRERELKPYLAEVVREEFDQTAREIAEVRAAWSGGGASDASGHSWVLRASALEHRPRQEDDFTRAASSAALKSPRPAPAPRAHLARNRRGSSEDED